MPTLENGFEGQNCGLEAFFLQCDHHVGGLFSRWQCFCVRRLHAGVFFVVCMALLMLSLIKSMLVVKLLYHNEKEVKQMSVSACLLDKYGSGGHDFTESALTSLKTLEYINPSDGELHSFLLTDGGWMPWNLNT